MIPRQAPVITLEVQQQTGLSRRNLMKAEMK